MRSGGRADAAILSGPENISRVGKQSSEPDSSRGLIHLAVGEKEFPRLRVGYAITENQLER